MSNINGCTNKEKLLWIRVSLKKAADVACNCFDHETQNSYLTIKAALYERFEPQSKRELYRVEFENRSRKEGDTLSDFSDELMVLVHRAFPGLQNESQEVLALNKYLLN